MREYNDLKQAMKYAGTGLTLVMAIAASGCAHQQAEPELAPAAPATPLPERAAPVVRENTVSSQLRADAPLRYVVKKGDTLWDIAGYYLKEAKFWLTWRKQNLMTLVSRGLSCLSNGCKAVSR